MKDRKKVQERDCEKQTQIHTRTHKQRHLHRTQADITQTHTERQTHTHTERQTHTLRHTHTDK